MNITESCSIPDISYNSCNNSCNNSVDNSSENSDICDLSTTDMDDIIGLGDEILPISLRILGIYYDTPLKLIFFNNKYYFEWGSAPYLQRKSCKNFDISAFPIDTITDIQAITFIETDMRLLELDLDKKCIFRIIDPFTSIRQGKFGTVVIYKNDFMVKPYYISLKKCKFNYMTATTRTILEFVYKDYFSSLKKGRGGGGWRGRRGRPRFNQRSS